MKWPLTLLCCLLVAFQAPAANYFVDYAAGSDAAAGTSTSVPWKHCPGDPSATSTASSTALAAGDTVFFKGGISYVLTAVNPNPPAVNNVVVNGPVTATNVNWSIGIPIAGIALNWSGTIGSRITYDGNTSGAWGTGLANITDNFSTNNYQAFRGATVSNMNFLGLNFTNIGGSNFFPSTGFAPVSSDGFPPKPGGGIGASQAINVTVSNCSFEHLGYWQTGVTNMGNSTLAGGGIGILSCDNLSILNCDFGPSRDPLYMGNGNIFNLTVSNCVFHDNMEWALTCNTGDSNQYRSNLTIVSCTFSNTDQYYGVLWTSQIVSAIFSLFPFKDISTGPHQNCIQMFNPQDGSGNYGLPRFPADTNVYIYNNTFITTLGHTGGTACIQLQESTTADIYNNVFILPTTGNGVIDVLEPCTNAPYHIGVYNNSFFSAVPSVEIGGANVNGFNEWPTILTGYIINVENNVISTISKGDNGAFDVTINTLTNMNGTLPRDNIYYDYNAFFCDQVNFPGTNAIILNWQDYLGAGVGQFYFLISETTSTFGWNTHSIQVPAPPYVYTNWGASPELVDLHLLSNSAPVNAGVNLTSLGLPGLTVDRDGNQRVASGAWTMGAYGTGVFASPTNLMRCCR